MKEVFRKADKMKALRWINGNDEEIKKFIDYRNKFPLFTEDGNQIQIQASGRHQNSADVYLGLGDWVITHNGIPITALSNERFKEKYIEV